MMSVHKRGALIATVVGAGVLLGAGPAAAWPIPYTSEDIRYTSTQPAATFPATTTSSCWPESRSAGSSTPASPPAR